MSAPGEALNLELGTDRFELIHCLGEGAFGVVFEAFDRERESTVALKALHALHGGAIYDLKQEFRGVAGLSHKNLVMVHELFASGPRPFFTMELALGELVQSGAALVDQGWSGAKAGDALRVATEACDAAGLSAHGAAGRISLAELRQELPRATDLEALARAGAREPVLYAQMLVPAFQ